MFQTTKNAENISSFCSQPGADPQPVGAQHLHLQPQNISGEIEMLQHYLLKSQRKLKIIVQGEVIGNLLSISVTLSPFSL